MSDVAGDIIRIANEVHVSPTQVATTVQLLDEGNTVPFITRYRKDRTGGLDEEQIRAIQSAIAASRQVAERAATILKSIESQGKLTDALRRQILAAESLRVLEDLYLPYKPRRRSRADAARELGLEPLADELRRHRLSDAELQARARSLSGSREGLETAEIVIQGVVDILAEGVSERTDCRDIVRETTWRTGFLESKLIADAEEAAKFQDYQSYEERLVRIPPHRVLALNRGESDKALRIKVRWEKERAVEKITRLLQIHRGGAPNTWQQAIEEAVDRLIGPSIEREIRRELTERADTHAVEVFSRNLRQLLLQPPLTNARVLAIDPGFRTGCKIAALDESGQVLTHDVIYLTGNDDKLLGMQKRLAELVREYGCRVVAIGNGTGCREAEQLVARMIQQEKLDIKYIVVNEAGASIYSASDVARQEFPELDATVRGTISIGRRLQDPLSELVKIEPQHVGVGMYQHDVSQKSLQSSLDGVVESCVNFVGVELNHASAALLRHVSGLTPNLAQKVVTYREQHGPFRKRRELLEVPGIGNGTFTQAAGFLKISDGDEPLDATWVHPESYTIAQTLLKRFGIDRGALQRGAINAEDRQRLETADIAALASELAIDPFTLQQVIEALSRPGRDPREELPGPLFRSEILKLEDLSVGMELTGVVRNVVDFGAFVDIGLKDSGLVHISQMSREYISSPLEVVSVGDVVTVWVLNIDLGRRRVGLTLLRAE